MSAAICGTGSKAVPGCRSAHPGYKAGQARCSPHERSDMRETRMSRASALIRATTLHRVVSITGSRPIRRASWRSRANTRSPASAAEFAAKPQHQRAALDHHRRVRQHAGHRGGHQIGDAQRGAEHARAIEHAGRGELAQARRQFLVAPGRHGGRRPRAREGAAGMVDADEGRVGDDVERLLAAIVGMRAPADIGEQAGGVAQPPLLGGLVDAGRRHEAVGPARSAPRHARASASAAR